MEYIKRVVNQLGSWFASRNAKLGGFIVAFAVAGSAALLFTQAATPSVSVEAENGVITGNATRVNGVSGSSNNSYVKYGGSPAGPAARLGGIQMVWGANSNANYDFVNAGHIAFKWPEIEPVKGTYCWNNPRQLRGGVQVGCGTSTDNSANGLAKQLEYIASLPGNKKANLRINSTTKPSWIYSNGVEKCGEQAQLIYSSLPPYDIPKYWNDDGTPNTTFFALMQDMLTSFSNTVNADPNKASVFGIQASPNLVGSEFNVAKDSVPHVGGTITIDNPNCNNWTPAMGAAAYKYAMEISYSAFSAAGIKPILRLTGFTGLKCTASATVNCYGPDYDYNMDPNTYLVARPGVMQAWFFSTSANIDATYEAKNGFSYTWARTGRAVGVEEQVIDSNATGNNSTINNPVSWNYWTILMQLDKGITYLSTFYQDIQIAAGTSSLKQQYLDAFNFANKYAGYFGSSKATTSPGAWIAFAPVASEVGNQGYTKGNFTQFMTDDLTDGSKGVSSLGAATNCFLLTVSQCPGVSMIGPTDQRFGRWARRTDLANGKATILSSLDPAFKSSLSGTVKVYVTYLDSGTGSWTLKWGGGQQAFTKANSGRWVTVGVDVPVSQINKTVSGNDFGLTATTSDTTFHMIEVSRY